MGLLPKYRHDPGSDQPHHCTENRPNQETAEVEGVVFIGRMSLAAGNDKLFGRDGAKDQPVQNQPVPQVEGKGDPESIGP